MKKRIVNERQEWEFWFPDSIADWDAPSHWERMRFASMERHLERGDILFDVGAEHGWISAIYGREFVGPENMVLFEPSPEFWPNIFMTWEANGFPPPKACFAGFVGEQPRGEYHHTVFDWPPQAAPGAEVGGLPYRHMNYDREIPVCSIDSFCADTGLNPDAITIDVEGAEGLVLHGARQTLEQERPLVWVSMHPDLMVRDGFPLFLDVIKFMVGKDYVPHFLGVDHEQHWLFFPCERMDEFS